MAGSNRKHSLLMNGLKFLEKMVHCETWAESLVRISDVDSEVSDTSDGVFSKWQGQQWLRL